MIATRDGDRHVLAAGDTVYAPPGEAHWHGAAPDSSLLHTAVSLGTTRWLGEVTDDQYKAAWDEHGS
jgi:quercetin dioxygenase-like cupin family protein